MPNKKILMIIAAKDFRDEEYFIPKSVFENAGFEVITAGPEKGDAIGTFGGVAKIDLTTSQANAENFDAIVFSGGDGAQKHFADKTFHKIAQEAFKAGKIIGAVCIAPVILANAGILSGKKATVWSSPMDKSSVKILQENGAKYSEDKIIIDGNVITAQSVDSSRKFAESIIKLLTANI